ncbi:MAG: hypothetical protein KatS3mg002_0633 [Candidatus Woesearchaeota archaeon]|nr:MAG: hypothetical protein KatS3mg002_0633 [Candidatus Woesearchaeota archaeon]
MTFESTKFYIRRKDEKKLNEIIEKEYYKELAINTEKEAGIMIFKKIKSKEIMTKQEFNKLIDYLKINNTRMTSIIMYAHTEGEYYIKKLLEKKYSTEGINLVIESNEIHNILSHTDLEKNVTNFMKWFISNEHNLETQIPKKGMAIYRIKIIDIKGYDSKDTWDFVKEASKGSYFKRQSF